ncbi:hypothetical protein [Chryseolinea soli]|uniref:T9SS C-terminal target domain-containing protein n=1 Tax=Chryseolinea soli TaxID=2321403 RepID=A0A385SL07_9BACT|nr:hypothetical protein [Chryseolinea soli]AYB31919.1 hypothetical protein D4L85_15700 [Chryseolinea soli]
MKNKLKKLAVAALGVVSMAAFLNACSDEPVANTQGLQGSAAALPIKIIGGATECVTTNLTTQTWRDTIYIIKGDVRVPNNVTLTINAGTIVKGDKATVGTLSVERGGKLNAIGTASQPIVFTSTAVAGSRAQQDWGGVNLFGKAPNNQSVNAVPEGYPVCLTAPQHGGTVSNDNSGRLSYVRIEFGGKKTGVADVEKNGLTLYSVGSGTILDHIQVSYGGDDAFEWFGGSVNAKYLVSYRNKDDDFDTDWGYSGAVQYGVAVRDPQVADDSKSNGFESDTDADGVNGTRTTAQFSNFTLIGPYDPANTRTVINTPGTAEFGEGLHLRRNTGLDVYNTLVVGWKRGLYLDDTPAAELVTTSILTHNLIAQPFITGVSCVYEPVAPNNAWTLGASNVCSAATLATSSSTDNNGLIRKSGLTSAAWTLTNPSFLPQANLAGPVPPAYTSPVLATGTNASLINPFFDVNGTVAVSPTTYFKGARRAADDNGWNLSGTWLNFDPQNTPYN